MTNVRALAGSQLCTDRGVSALLSNWRSETPLVLIVGSKCRASPVSLLSMGLMVEFNSTSILCYGLVSGFSCLGFTRIDEVDGSVSLTPRRLF
jgi:hypothetical protein